MVAGKPLLAEIKAFLKLQEMNTPENVQVIQNSQFDLPMLEKENFTSKMQLFDILRCMWHLEPDREAHRLQYLRYALGLYKRR